MSGRHRRVLAFRGAGVVAAALAVVVLLAGSWFGYQRLSEPECSGSIRLSVAAATEIVPAVEQAAQRWTTGGGNVGGTCVAVGVTGVNPSVMAAAVAREHKVTLTGVGSAPESVAVPDVWVPDSSTWLLRLRGEAPGFTPSDGASIAQSPVVVAMPAPLAQQRFGWPGRKPAWKDLLDEMRTSPNLRPGVVDPTRDAAGLTGLLALAGAAGAGAAGQAAKVAALRSLATGSSALRDDLLAKFPRSDDPAGLAAGLSAAPLSEEDVVAYNAERPPVELAALYLDPQPPGLDYPYAVMPGADPQKTAAAAGLRQALQQSAFRDALAAAGLRGADGTTGAGFTAPAGAPATIPPAAAPVDAGSRTGAAMTKAVGQLLGSWAAITLPGRVLAVFDVSGSMLTPVPTARGATRAAVTRAAAAQGLALFDDRWAVGNWIFATELEGRRPWRELVPITPLASGRERLQAAIEKIEPKPDGDTGLYDTALAAYRTVQGSWQAGRVNSVILFTDGKNENPGGLSRRQLVAELTKLNDPERPVRMVIIGIGNEVDRDELQAIVGATSAGGVFIAEDPARMGEIFLEAIGTRTGANG